MAPEVAKGWQYDKMVDVYSFGILLWEIAALQPAFPNHQTRDQMHRVWSGDERPPMASWWPVELQWLMKKCWSYFANSRPDFTVISETLDEILDDGMEEEEARGVKSFRFGSRRSQKISHDSDNSNNGARRVVTLRPRDLPEELPRKILGLVLMCRVLYGLVETPILHSLRYYHRRYRSYANLIYFFTVIVVVVVDCMFELSPSSM
jgi:serine/threonine protein kinase